MALSFSGTAQYLTKAGAVLSTTPITFACWYNAASLTVSAALLSISNQATNNSYWQMFVGTTGTVAARTEGSGVGAQSATVATLSTSSWHHCAALFTSATSRTAYLDGVAATVQTTSVTPSLASAITAIGTAFNGSVTATNVANGSASFPAIWNIALSTADIAELASGAHPLCVHPEALVCCPQLNGNSPEIDLVSATTWALTGSPTLAANPSIYYPFSRPFNPVFPGTTWNAASTIGSQTSISTITSQILAQPVITLLTSPRISTETAQAIHQATDALSPKVRFSTETAQSVHQATDALLTQVRLSTETAQAVHQCTDTIHSNTAIPTETATKAAGAVTTLASHLTFSTVTAVALRTVLCTIVSHAQIPAASPQALLGATAAVQSQGILIANPFTSTHISTIVLKSVDDIVLVSGTAWHIDQAIARYGLDALQAYTYGPDQIQVALSDKTINP